jgi:hypothetical protein
MTLSDLYPAGTKLAEVNPNFRGMPLKTWQALKIVEQAEAHRKALNLNPEDAPLSKQRVYTPRDGYGMKSI